MSIFASITIVFFYYFYLTVSNFSMKSHYAIISKIDWSYLKLELLKIKKKHDFHLLVYFIGKMSNVNKV